VANLENIRTAVGSPIVGDFLLRWSTLSRLGPDRRYDVRHLVPQHLRKMNAMIHCAMEDVQVSAASALLGSSRAIKLGLVRLGPHEPIWLD
jgi:hypothetical protein